MTPELELQHLASATEQEVKEYLAMRVRRERRRKGLSQPAFAAQAGIAERTYKRFELHGEGSIETLIKIFFAFNHVKGFYTLFPQVPIQKASIVERIEVIRRREKSHLKSNST